MNVSVYLEPADSVDALRLTAALSATLTSITGDDGTSSFCMHGT